jgi:uncharacterized protein YukJ
VAVEFTSAGKFSISKPKRDKIYAIKNLQNKQIMKTKINFVMKDKESDLYGYAHHNYTLDSIKSAT